MGEYTGPDWAARKAEPTLLDTMRVAGIADRLTAWVQQASENQLLRVQSLISDLRPSQAQSLGCEGEAFTPEQIVALNCATIADEYVDWDKREHGTLVRIVPVAAFIAGRIREAYDLVGVRQLPTPQPEVAETVELPDNFATEEQIADAWKWVQCAVEPERHDYPNRRLEVCGMIADAFIAQREVAALRTRLAEVEAQRDQLGVLIDEACAMGMQGVQALEAAEQSLAAMTAERDAAVTALTGPADESGRMVMQMMRDDMEGARKAMDEARKERDEARSELERLKAEMDEWTAKAARSAPTAETEKPGGGE